MFHKRRNQESTVMLLTMIGLSITLLLGGVVFLIASGGAPITWMLLGLLVMGGLFAGGGVMFASVNNAQKLKPKQKLGMDMYSLIDDLIEDLSPEEAIYLKRLIDDAYKEDIDSSISELLEHRQARKQ